MQKAQLHDRILKHASKQWLKNTHKTNTDTNTHRVDSKASTCCLQSLHVALLSTPQRNDALLGKQVQWDGVNSLLVDHHEALVGRASAHLRACVRVRVYVAWSPLNSHCMSCHSVAHETRHFCSCCSFWVWRQTRKNSMSSKRQLKK